MTVEPFILAFKISQEENEREDQDFEGEGGLLSGDINVGLSF